MKQFEITSYIFLEKKYIFYILSRTVPFGTNPVSGRGAMRSRTGFSGVLRASPPLRHFSVPAA